MSFNSRESSLADGQPVRLYQFSRGAIRWSYNSSDRDITYQNQVFRTVPGGITDNGINTSCRTCTATLGDHRCKVNLIPYRVTLTPQIVSAWVISSGVVAGYADDWFTGG